MGYVFISYSTKNQLQADSMKDLLNRNGISTWMAPYDIPTGNNYLEEIPNAIKNSSCVILLLSKASQDSHWVLREMERAATYRNLIIPIMIEDMKLNDKFSFIIGTSQITAIKQIDDSQENVINLIERLNNILGLTQEQKEENVKNSLNNKKINIVEEKFYTLIQQLYDNFFDYKVAFRLANQEDIIQTSQELQNICHQLFTIKEKHLDDNTNIATKVGQIIDQYNDYVGKYNHYIEEIKKGYSDKSNERALEAETAFNEIEKIVRSFL